MMIGLNPSMAEALRLTRSGKLVDATNLIQAMLRGSGTASASPAPESTVTFDLKPVCVRIAPSTHTAATAEAGTAFEKENVAGATFDELCYSASAGRLSYRLYVPAQARTGMPLVVMLHGCTQSPEDFARGTGMNRLADELGFLVAYPAQAKGANAQRCWNWFKPAHQQRDRGEPATIAGITRQIIAEHGADAGRVYVAGLSAGGAAAAVLGAAYPDLYAAIGIHSGLACGAARDLPGAMLAMRTGGQTAAPRAAGACFVPIITFHGDRDAIVAEINSRKIVSAATAAAGGQLQVTTKSGVSAGGRAYTREISSNTHGTALIEQWTLHSAGHAWSGGDASGSYTDPAGPDASREMLRFFLQHHR